MEHKIITQEEPIRLFKSDFLEFFTHIHPALIPLIWLPVALYFLGRAFILHPIGHHLGYIPLGVVFGLFLWSLAEYLLHRFVFHFKPRNPTQERIVFLFHSIHHLQPQCKTRLVMPPIVSIPLALLFYGFFWFIFANLLPLSLWLAPVFSGFIIGYIAYDMTHYATHHLPMRRGIWKALKRHHMRHHYKTPDQRFGVSSPLWDYVFMTTGKEKERG
jgi:sterol desaturase/sphingolipid hydroxylase (fatty acid hydroxylase superfamily)